MSQFRVKVVIGTEYLYLIEAEDEQHAEYIIQRFDPTDSSDKFAPNVKELEQEAGRAIVNVSEFHYPPCSTCGEAFLDCVEASVETGEIMQTFEQLREHYSKVNDDTARQLAIVLDAYLTHGVSPCNSHSRA